MSTAQKTTAAKLEIDSEVGRSWTLPASVYLDANVLEREKSEIFWRTWQIVGRREQVADVGDYFCVELLGEPLLITRDKGGELRGFFNVCRHRAGPPAVGCGNRKVFRCGYHGWTYSLDGHLLNAPEMDGTENFRFEDFSLKPVQVAEWGLWVFVNLDDNTASLPKFLGKLPQQVERFEFEKLKLFERRDYIMDCNWKVYIDNYLEGYHLPSVHPGLNRELDYSAYTIETYENYSRQWSPIRGLENESTTQRRYSQAKGDDIADYYWVFPNWMLNCYPDNMSLNIVLPLGLEKTLAIFEWYFSEEALKRDAPETTVKFSDEIQIEDGAICEAVHKNLKSRAYDRGRFSAKQERCVHHFHKLYAERMG
jgi:choline monooxygenase